MNKRLDKQALSNQKMLDYCQELVIIIYMHEQNMLTEEEMLAVKQVIKNSYGIVS